MFWTARNKGGKHCGTPYLVTICLSQIEESGYPKGQHGLSPTSAAFLDQQNCSQGHFGTFWKILGAAWTKLGVLQNPRLVGLLPPPPHLSSWESQQVIVMHWLCPQSWECEWECERFLYRPASADRWVGARDATASENTIYLKTLYFKKLDVLFDPPPPPQFC